MHRFWKSFLFNGIWWLFIILLWTTFTHSEIKTEHEQLDHFVPIRILLTVSSAILLAFFNVFIEWVIERRGTKFKVSFRKKMFLLIIRQLFFISILAIVIFSFLRLSSWGPVETSFHAFLTKFELGKFWIYIGLAAYLFEVIKAVDQKLGPGNLWKLMIGEFSKPKELERIFMFLDLKDSTTLAEQLGHITYSELIQDCFHDISVVRFHEAEVFQYVGDEVVLVWKPAQGISSFNCIEAYFSFMNRIAEKQAYYQNKYGLIPFFKAGIHIGKIVLAEVGEIKREIAYHGDTINTASRIQKKCNDFNQSLVVSEKLIEVFDQMDIQSKYNIERLGSVALKGKDENINIIGLQRR